MNKIIILLASIDKISLLKDSWKEFSLLFPRHTRMKIAICFVVVYLTLFF